MIPFAPTTITVLRPKDSELNREPYQDTPDMEFEVVATGVRASIGVFSRTVSATERTGGGEQATQVLQLTCDVPSSDLTHLDEIIDETTGIRYIVHWCLKRIALGLDHYTAEIYRWEGLVS